MSKRREVINFSEGPLPDDKITQIIGATLTCLSQSDSYDKFKSCLFVQPEGESLVTAAADMVGNAADSVSDAAADVSDSMTFKGKKSFKKK